MEMHSTAYDQEQDEIRSYRPVSFVCVTALVGGILSVVALAHPILWLFPSVFFFVGLIGLRNVTKKSDQYVGKSAAVIGICAAVLFLSVSVSRYYSERLLVAHHARQFGQEWLESLLTGQHEKAHQGWLEYYYRQPKGTRLADYYAQNETDIEDLAKFLELETVREICGFSPEAEVKFVRTDAIYRSVEGHTVYLIYEVADATKDAIQVLLQIKRIPEDDNVYWSVNEIHKPIK